MMPASRVSDATSAIKARHRRQTRRRLIRIGAAVLAVVLVGSGVWLIWFSPVFISRSVEVFGITQGNTQEIIAAANVPLRTPLATLDVQAIKERVEEVPIVAKAEITRVLSGTIRITVTERQPVYVLLRDSSFILVDAVGKGYLTLDSAPPDLPIVSISTTSAPMIERLMADAAVISMALPEPILAVMTSMTAATPDTFTIYLTNGAQILWGSSEESDLKAEVIVALINVKANYYDVSSPAHPATR
ncbi:MAG: FtsQ-type POTRA domain-containing protein [Propionibacteriaceae bacterium]|nr:FtsQ-type POTRA domain-containing protein [Propionibacteriaceae bacterium]